VVRCYYSIASLKESSTDSIDISHTLRAIAEPCATVDMYHYWEFFHAIFLWDVDVEVVILFTITYIVDVTINLATKAVSTIVF
jgi:hypothetical protein